MTRIKWTFYAFSIFFPYNFLYAVDTFDASSGHLTIPEVVAGSTKYFDLVVTLKALISGGDVFSPLSTTTLSSRPDTYDLKRNQLIAPAVVVGSTVYKNLVLTLDKVVSFEGKEKSGRRPWI